MMEWAVSSLRPTRRAAGDVLRSGGTMRCGRFFTVDLGTNENANRRASQFDQLLSIGFAVGVGDATRCAGQGRIVVVVEERGPDGVGVVGEFEKR